MAYFPAAIFLEKIEPNRLWFEMALEAAWLCLFVVFARVLYSRGLKRYSGFGG
jgi:ABC-2 type transport system permease protein